MPQISPSQGPKMPFPFLHKSSVPRPIQRKIPLKPGLPEEVKAFNLKYGKNFQDQRIYSLKRELPGIVFQALDKDKDAFTQRIQTVKSITDPQKREAEIVKVVSHYSYSDPIISAYLKHESDENLRGRIPAFLQAKLPEIHRLPIPPGKTDLPPQKYLIYRITLGIDGLSSLPITSTFVDVVSHTLRSKIQDALKA